MNYFRSMSGLFILSVAACSADAPPASTELADSDAVPYEDVAVDGDDAAPPGDSSVADVAAAPDTTLAPDTATSDARTDAETSPPAYDPCPPAGAPCVVMPLGDSITYGIASTSGGGYRIELLRKARAAGHDVTFVGWETSGPDTLDGKPFPKSNEGHSGFTIDDAPSVGRSGLAPIVADSLKLHKPHIVTLMIGTNDIDQNNDVTHAPERLGRLLDIITTTSPEALVVVAQIIPTGHDDENALVRAYNTSIVSVVEARKSAGKHVVWVDMYGPFVANPAFKTAWMSDFLHPNDAGFVVMAKVWYDAIGGWFH